MEKAPLIKLIHRMEASERREPEEDILVLPYDLTPERPASGSGWKAEGKPHCCCPAASPYMTETG